MSGGADRGSVAILAGSGRLPIQIADRLVESGRTVRILAFRGFADRVMRERADAVVGLLDVGRAVSWLDSWRPDSVTLAGAVSRPSPAAVVDAFSLLRDRSEVAAVAAKGDDNLLRGVVMLLEERGHRLVGVRDLAPELLAAACLYGRIEPEGADRLAMQVGFDLLRALSPFDIGQSAVVRGEHVLAVEGPEGTDRMLGRVAKLGVSLPFWRRTAVGGILVKGPKDGQDLRIDLPTIGPRTVIAASRAGLRGIAVVSGCTLVVERERTVAEADRRGLFLLGVPAPGRAG